VKRANGRPSWVLEFFLSTARTKRTDEHGRGWLKGVQAMKQPLRSTAGALGAAVLAFSGVGHAASLNVVKGLEVKAAGEETVVTIAGSQAPVYTVFRLESPPRLVVDLAAADLSAVQGTSTGQGGVRQISASQFADGKQSVGRVVIALADDARYDVQADGSKVLVKVSEHGQPAHTQSEGTKAPAAAVAAATPAPVAAPEAAVTADGTDAHLIRRDLSEKSVAHAASRVLGAKLSHKGAATRLDIATDAAIGTYEILELREPSRLALDLKGVKGSAKLSINGTGPLKALRAGKQTDGMRLVIDTDPLIAGSYRVERTAHGLALIVGAPAAAVVAQKAPAVESGVKTSSIQDISFKGDESKAAVAVELPRGARYEISRPDAHTAVLTVHQAKLPGALERSLDTSAFGGPVKMVSSFVAKDSGDVQIVATLDGEVKDEVKESAKGLKWTFAASEDVEMMVDGVRIDLSDSTVSRAAGMQSEAPAYALSSAPRKPRYTGRRVSFEFKDIDIHNLLRIIAEVSKKNLIVSDDVTGKITIRLRNVPWDQALDVILKTKGLDKEETGNILRVVKAEQLAAEREAAVKRRESLENSGELKLRLIPVNYADANDMTERVKDLLSKRGSVTVDKRTNVLIVKDVSDSLARVEGLVHQLDQQTPQVLIEARIVEASSTFSRELGIQWGGQIGFSPSTGNPTGLVFPNTAIVTGGVSPNQQFPGLGGTPNFAVDLPAAVGTGNGAGLGFVFGSAGGAAQLNLRISALENSGSAKTISAPRVTTLDNNAATISQGVAIPFSQFSAGGVNTTFIEAKLELKVKPHVTADGSVALTIDATNNQPNPGFTGANGQPSISKKEAHTQVLVKDGDTTVIGGIYTRASSQNENGVPLLSKIPVLGWLFRHRAESDTRTELLIFVTPHIVNRSQTVASMTPANNP
jgi:type IV pilus assembly protein PilQ